jgi:hypothetical protein
MLLFLVSRIPDDGQSRNTVILSAVHHQHPLDSTRIHVADALAHRRNNTLGGKKTLWPESASELYRPSNRGFSAKLVRTFADRGCHVVSVMGPYGSILGFLGWIIY